MLGIIIGTGAVIVLMAFGKGNMEEALEDIRRLAKLGLAGCIIGRALYEGKLDLSEVIKEAVTSH